MKMLSDYKVINRVIIVGFGSIGKRHYRIARLLLPAANIYILSTHSEKIELNGPGGFFRNIDDAINFKPQIVIVANPSSRHIAVANIFSKLGAHLLVEKPISDSASGVLELILTCQQSGVVLSVGYNLRFFESLIFFKKSLEIGLIGNLCSVRCEVGQHLSLWRPGVEYKDSVSAQKSLGGGALLELSHEIDYLEWLFGGAEWVQAHIKNQGSLDVDVEDVAHLVIGYSNKPIAGGREFAVSLIMDFLRPDATRMCTVIGTKGALKWNGISGEVSQIKLGDTEWQKIFNGKNELEQSYIDEWKSFLSNIEHQTLPIVGGFDGLKVMHIIDAARASSSDLGRRVEIHHKPPCSLPGKLQ